MHLFFQSILMHMKVKLQKLDATRKGKPTANDL